MKGFDNLRGNLKLPPNLAFKTGLISATTVGGMDRTEIFYKNYLSNPKGGNLGNIRSHDCGDSTEKIAQDLGISGFMTTISTACSSAANAIMLGARMIKSGQLDRVLVGGTDALTRFTLNGFNSLKIVSNEPCRPFDQHRKGLNLGEGAAFLLLESDKSLEVSQNESLALVTGYGNTNDSYHQTASSPEGTGATNAMKQALKIAKIKPLEIDYINAHGTATPNNDQSEGTAFLNVFGKEIPQFGSTKSFTGHTLAAAGALEAVFSVLALKHRFLPPNLNFKTPIEELGIRPIPDLKKDIELKNVLSNSFGFGGNCTSLIFSV